MILDRLAAAELELERQSSRLADAVCRMCDDSPSAALHSAAFRCIDCGDDMCHRALSVHKKIKALSGHTVLSLGDLGSARPTARAAPRCTEHDKARAVQCAGL